MGKKKELARRLVELEQENAEQRDAMKMLAKKLDVKLPKTRREERGAQRSWELNEEELGLVFDDKPIKAIKKYRKRTGAGLTEGKFVVDDALKRYSGKKDDKAAEKADQKKPAAKKPTAKKAPAKKPTAKKTAAKKTAAKKDSSKKK